MKFAEKYEIVEMVTTGRVSTFLARDRVSQDAVVVYTFEYAATGARELSTASIIARFCSLAPNPPGIIIKAGFDERASSAFITTKMPDPAALKAWVEAYHSFVQPTFEQTGSGQASTGKGDADPFATPTPAARQESNTDPDATVELNAFEVKSALARSAPPQKKPTTETPGPVTAAFPASAPAQAPPKSEGDFTRLFREVSAFEPVHSTQAPVPAKPSNATDAIFGEKLGSSPLGGEFAAPAKPAAPAQSPTPADSSPGSFTREFLGLSSEVEAASKASPPTAAPQKEPGAFTREFMAVSKSARESADEPAARPSALPPAQQSPPASDTAFDSIFGTGEPAASRPGSTSTASFGGGISGGESRKETTGEFTKFFRDPFEHPGAPEKSIPLPDVVSAAPPKKDTGEFTRVFGRADEPPAEAPSPIVEEKQPAPGSFTQLFGQTSQGPGKGSQLGMSTLNTSPNARPSFLDPAPMKPAPPPPAPAPPVPAAPPDLFRGGTSSTAVPPTVDPLFSRAPSATPPAANQMFMGRAGSPEATSVFRAPGGEAPPEVPSGPSEFTMFLSRSQLNASLPPDQALPGSPAAAPPPVVAPPPVPPPPFQFAPPPAPAPPAMKFPPPPAVPAPPAIPGAAVPAAPKAASFWPLITVLTVLVAIGILLVMYFVLKH